jgi:hypothetical protein
MLISYRHKFIFIHNPKVAGLSIKRALEKYALNSPSTMPWLNKISEYSSLSRRANFYLFNIIPWLDNFSFHGSARALRPKIGEKDWNRFFKFGFVRNPWDREVSLYHYIKNKKKHHLSSLYRELGSFDAYVRWIVSQKRQSQREMFYGREGEKLVDFIGKFENLEDDLRIVCRNLNIDAQLPHVNLSKRKANYREYYSPETRKIIEEHCQDDIIQFGYEF